jgi:hypothetical protein
VIVAKVPVVLATAVSLIGAAAAMGIFTDTGHEPPSPVWEFIFAGACIALARWLYLIGQVVPIRAAVERQK